MMTPVGPSDSLIRLLVRGARPRTLPAAVVPVVVGAACVPAWETSTWWRGVLALVVSIALQVAVNYANDYSDGIKGTDADRVGPLRLVGSGLVEPRIVKRAAFAMMALAGACGLVLAAVTSWWVLAIGVAAMIATWTYTGGPRPYGYAGFGEVFVFVFFGVVATVGTQFVMSEETTASAWWASIGVGAFACALLVVNNLRDRPNDAVVGKRTLAVAIGDAWTRRFFVALFVVAAVATCVTASQSGGWALIGLAGIVAVIRPVSVVVRGAHGQELIAVLGQVGLAQLVFGASLAVGVSLGG